MSRAADIVPSIPVDPTVPAEAPYDFAALNRVNDTHPLKRMEILRCTGSGVGFPFGKEKGPGPVADVLVIGLDQEYEAHDDDDGQGREYGSSG